MEFANEIYLFVEIDGKRGGNKGIKFYDRTPSTPEQKFSGELDEDVYFTDKHSIEPAEWDPKVNKPDETVRVYYMDGSHNATTYMLSTSKMSKVLWEIEEAVKRGDKVIRIDLSDLRAKVGERDTQENAHNRNSGNER